MNKSQSHFYQYHQHLQYQSKYHAPRTGSWSSSPDPSGSPRPLLSSLSNNQKAMPQQPPVQQKSRFNFSFLHKAAKEKQTSNNHAKKREDKGKKEKENGSSSKDKGDTRTTKQNDSEGESSLIENYLSNRQNSKKFGLTLQQQYFQNQQQKMQQESVHWPPQQQVPTRRILESHAYQNVCDEHHSHPQQKPPSPTINQQMYRKFGDTGQMMPRKGNGSRKNIVNIEDGVYRYSPHVTSFAELDYANKNSGELDQKAMFNISKYLNIDIKSNSSAYSSASNISPSQNNDLGVPKRTSNHRSSPNLHQSNGDSSASSLLSEKSSCSTSSLDQNCYFIGDPGPEYGSYLGPFNFRQLLRPTQGPTESLRKRKGINTNSPPPPQKGKNFI